MNIVKHTFGPIFNKESKILILGSFPSVLSRKNGFYYSHPQNRFWKVISKLTDSKIPESLMEKRYLLINNKIALWDVVGSCTINGSSDVSINNVVPNNMTIITGKAKIDKIYANGNTAYKLYMQYCFKHTGIEIIKLPSTSPANASYSLERLIECWRQIIY